MILTLSPHIKKDYWQEKDHAFGSTVEMSSVPLMQEDADCEDDHALSNADDTIYYFAYGLMVHPMARHARGVTTESATAALLPNHRLNFTVGGSANIEAKTGWEVYGVLMKCSPKVWDSIEEFESGFDCVEVDVYTLKQKEELEQEDEISIEKEGFAQVHDTPIRARTFVVPEAKKQTIPSRIPQERTLRVIAAGLELYNVDQDYVNDEIMGVEFIPRREPKDYHTFPNADGHQQKELPKLTLAAWEKEYWKRMKKATKKKKDIILFRLGEYVMEVTDVDPEHPFCIFLNQRLHGPQDSTWRIVQTFFDPDMPIIKSEAKVTEKHHAWAEDQMAEKFQLSNFEAKRIYRVVLPDTKEEGNTHGSISLTKDAMRNLQANIQSLSLLEQLEQQAVSSSANFSPPRPRRSGRKSGTSILKSTLGGLKSLGEVTRHSLGGFVNNKQHNSSPSLLDLDHDDVDDDSVAESIKMRRKRVSHNFFRRSVTDQMATRSVCSR